MFFVEDFLKKWSAKGKRLTERRVLLFDGVLVLCKPNTKRTAVSVTAPLVGATAEYRLKESFLIRKVEITDWEDPESKWLHRYLYNYYRKREHLLTKQK